VRDARDLKFSEISWWLCLCRRMGLRYQHLCMVEWEWCIVIDDFDWGQDHCNIPEAKNPSE
jgi:hypothetical protein